MKVGYLGPESSTFGYMAAEKFFSGRNDIEFVPYPSHYDVCCAVGKKKAQSGVVAIENAIDGAVIETVHAVEEMAGNYGLRVCGEVVLPIELFYLNKSGGGGALTKVLSHQTALRQCRRFIQALQERGISVEERSSTGEAAREASDNPEVAVIASARAAELYGLEYLQAESVADNSHNFTRFWVLGKDYADCTGRDKICFLVNLEQAQPGSFWRALGFFAQRGVNLLFMNLNPIHGRTWEYTFLVEFRGHIDDPEVEEAWQELRESGLCLGTPLFLGSYPDATLK